jgi:Ca2+-binding RTX toxin-like protein
VFETGGVDCSPSGSFTSLGFNVEKSTDDCGFAGTGDVVATATLLNSLANRGGPTQTHSLSLSSGVLNLIPLASCLGSDGLALTRDQRNAFRPGQGEAAMCDPGAYEVNRCGTALAEIVGTEGDDGLVGDAGEDAMLGMGGADTFDPGANDDDICGGDGNDLVLGHTQDNAADVFNGEAGSDTVTLEEYSDPATIDLATGQIIGPNLGADVLSSIENATGGPEADSLIGDGGPNVLHGNEGDDSLSARDGVADVVDCGTGTGDTAVTDQLSLDTVINCESVDALPEPPAPPLPAATNPPLTQPATKKCKKGFVKKKVKGKTKCVKKKRKT